MTFLPKKVIFPQNAPVYRARFWFFPNNPLCFYTKNCQKVHFPSNCAYNTGHFIDFSPKKVILSSKCACISSTILTLLPNNQVCFYTKNPKKLIFPQIVTITQGTLLTFLPKKVIFSSKCAGTKVNKIWCFFRLQL